MYPSLKIIISGGPCTGKSTVVETLRRRGYYCFDEVARQVIKEQQQLGSDLVPWLDLSGFSAIVFDRICTQAREGDNHSLCFFDRSAVDVLAYLENGGYERSKKLVDLIPSLNYSPIVFFTPFWEDIYTTDVERKENLIQAKAISDKIYQTYLSLGFQILELPLVSPEERADIIEYHISQYSL